MEVRNRQRFRNHLQEAIDAGQQRFTIDFTQTRYIDSSGLGALVGIARRLRGPESDMEMFGLNADLKELFELTKLDTIFTVLDELPAGEIDPWVPPEPEEIPEEEHEQDKWGTALDIDADPNAPIRVVLTEDEDADSPFALQILGEPIPPTEVSIWEYAPGGNRAVKDESGRVPLEMWVGSSARAEQLLNFPAREILPSAVVQAEVPLVPDWVSESQIVLTLGIRRRPHLRVDFTLRFNTLHWKGLWSIAEYAEEFERMQDVLEGSDLRVSSSLNPDDQTLEISAIQIPDSVALKTPVAAWLSTMREAHRETVRKLTAGLRSDSVIAYFQFPPEVRTAYEQYLLYFVQFLQDFGVEADAEIRHRGGHVLFAVTPASGREALERIRNALEVYLNLPSAPGSAVMPIPGQEPWAYRLVANLQHLNSQLTFKAGQLELQAAQLEYKNATIRQQESTITQQQVVIQTLRLQIVSGTLLNQSLRELLPRAEGDEESLIEGAISLVPVEGWGVKLELPEMLRRLKGLFSRD